MGKGVSSLDRIRSEKVYYFEQRFAELKTLDLFLGGGGGKFWFFFFCFFFQ